MNPLFSFVSSVSRALPHGARRFILDRMRLGGVLQKISRNRFATARVPGGYRVFFNPLLHGTIIHGDRLVYEEEIIKWLDKFLKNGDVFYDIGANVGVFSLIASARVGPGGIVIAIEPEENNLICLRRSLSENAITNVKVIDAAMGASDGTAIFDRRGGAFSGRIAGVGEEVTGNVKEVSVRSLDSLIEEGWPVPTLIKIDVEGSEDSVLAGGVEMLKRYRPIIICELHDFEEKASNYVISLLRQMNYIINIQEQAATLGRKLPRHILAQPSEPLS